MVTYTRSVSANFGGNIDILQFSDIIYASAISTNFTGGQTFGDVVELFFSVALTAPQIVILDGLISAYTYNSNYFPFDAVQEIQTIGNGQSMIDYKYGPNVMMYNINSGPTNLTSVTKSANTILIDGSGSLVNTSFYTTSNVKNIFPNSVVLTGSNTITIDANGAINGTSGVFGQNYQFVTANTVSATRAQGVVTGLTINANNLTNGFYRIAWTTLFNSSSNNKNTEIVANLNSVEVLGNLTQIPQSSTTKNSYSSFTRKNLVGNNEIRLTVQSTDPGGPTYTSFLENPRLEFYRVQ